MFLYLHYLVYVCFVLWYIFFWQAWSVCDASWVPFGIPRPPSPHYTLPRFILKVPGQPLRHSPKTRDHPGLNNKSKNHPRAHKRRSKPPQDLSFRYPWDRVPRDHKTSKLCMLHTRPCDAPYTHNAPTIYSD